MKEAVISQAFTSVVLLMSMEMLFQLTARIVTSVYYDVVELSCYCSYAQMGHKLVLRQFKMFRLRVVFYSFVLE